MNQKAIIKINHNSEPTKKANGDIFLKKKSAAEVMAKIFTSIIISRISLRVIK
jgi:hypothetical protein